MWVPLIEDFSQCLQVSVCAVHRACHWGVQSSWCTDHTTLKYFSQIVITDWMPSCWLCEEFWVSLIHFGERFLVTFDWLKQWVSNLHMNTCLSQNKKITFFFIDSQIGCSEIIHRLLVCCFHIQSTPLWSLLVQGLVTSVTSAQL